MTASAIHKSLPNDLLDAQEFWQDLCDVYGNETAADIVANMTKASDSSYWINPFGAGFEAIGNPIAALPGMYRVGAEVAITQTEAAGAGDIYIQNPSSMLAVEVLAPEADDEVLDLAAAPGGKTIAMAVRMGNTGRIAAVEPIKGRFHRLRANVDRCRVSNVDFYLRDGRGVGRAVGERFDRVLLDAPCSSQARMRWDTPATYQHWSRRKIKETQRKQKSLIRSAYTALKPGGVMVYCTCSLSVEENEAVVAHLLKRTDVELLPIDTNPPRHMPGVTSWQGRNLPEELALTMRVIADEVWDGFYLAYLRKPYLRKPKGS